MATDIELNTKIDTANAAQSLGELKKSLKDLISLQSQVGSGTEGFKKLQKSINDTENKLGDLKDGFKTLSGSGVERLTSSFGLLKEGFTSFDGGKISSAFKGVGAAMKAIPIFLIIEGIRYLVENFAELSKGSGVLATILRGVGDAITYVKNLATDLVGATDDGTRALEKQGKAIATNAEKLNTALSEQSAGFDRQITVAKAAGKNTIELEKKKQQAIIDTNFLIAKQIEAFVRAGGTLDDEKKKQLTASLDFIKNAKTQEKVIELTDNKEKQEAYKKHLEKLKEESLNAEKQKALDLQKQKEDDAAIELQSQHAINADKIVTETVSLTELNAIKAAKSAEEYAAWLKTEEGKLAAAKVIEEQKKAIQQQAFNVASQIAGLANQLFGQNKAVQKTTLIAENAIGIAKMIIANKTANTAALATPQAIATSGASAIPVIAFNNISTGLGIAASVAATAKALSVLGGGGSAGSVPNISGGISSSGGGTSTAPTTPTTNQPQSTTTFTGNNNNNFNQPIKTYVVETDLRNSTKTIDRIKEQSTF